MPSELEEVHVSAFVENGETVLVVPAHHWRLLVWLHAELAWKFSKHGHYVSPNGIAWMHRYE